MPVEYAESVVVRLLHRESKAELVVPLVRRYGDDLAECVPGTVALEVLDAVFSDEGVGKLAVSVHDAGGEADELGLERLGLVVQEQWADEGQDADGFEFDERPPVDQNSTEFEIYVPEVFGRGR